MGWFNSALREDHFDTEFTLEDERLEQDWKSSSNGAFNGDGPTARGAHSSFVTSTTAPTQQRRLALVGKRRERSTQISESHSVTDARARIPKKLAAKSGSAHQLRLSRGVPAFLVAGDIIALVIESLLVGFAQGQALMFAAAVLAARLSTRQYRQRIALSVLDDLPRILSSAVVGCGIALGCSSLIWNGPIAARELVARAGTFVLVSLLLQVVTFAVAGRARRTGRAGRRTLIVGAGRVGTTVSEALLEHPELGLLPVGFADPEPSAGSGQPKLSVLTTDMNQLARTISAYEVDTAILAFNGAGDAHVDTVINVHQTGCTVLIVPSMFELHHDGPDVERVRGVPLLRLRPDPTLRLSWWVKRGIDVFIGGLALALLAIPLALIALLVLIDSGRPILFWQERVGLDGQTFRLCKFRSMVPRPEAESQTTWNIANDPRMGRVGKFLRRSSIDEIPQLWNIVRGQMSLVGPRPERPTFVQQFTAEHERYWARHRVPVGLTGLAQVNGLRGDTSIRERARYDNYYIANWSLWLDAKIIMLTAREVLGGHGR